MSWVTATLEVVTVHGDEDGPYLSLRLHPWTTGSSDQSLGSVDDLHWQFQGCSQTSKMCHHRGRRRKGMPPAVARRLRRRKSESNIAKGFGLGGSTARRFVPLCPCILRIGSRGGSIELSTFSVNCKQTQMGYEGVHHLQTPTAIASFKVVVEPRTNDFDMVNPDSRFVSESC